MNGSTKLLLALLLCSGSTIDLWGAEVANGDDVVRLPPMYVLGDAVIKPVPYKKGISEVLPRFEKMSRPVTPEVVRGIGATVDVTFVVGKDGTASNFSPIVSLHYATKETLTKKAVADMIEVGTLPEDAKSAPLTEIRRLIALRFALHTADTLKSARFQAGKVQGQTVDVVMKIRSSTPRIPER